MSKIGTIKSIWRDPKGKLMGRVQDDTSAEIYTIYFSTSVNGIKKNDKVEYDQAVSGAGNAYAKYRRTVNGNAPAQTATANRTSTPSLPVGDSSEIPTVTTNRTSAILTAVANRTPAAPILPVGDPFEIPTLTVNRTSATLLATANETGETSAGNVSVTTEAVANQSEQEEVKAEDKYETVTSINKKIKKVYNAQTGFRNILVKGEVTNYTGKSKNAHYFAIKDGSELISCVLWEGEDEKKLSFELKSGIKVGILGDIDFYEQQGKTQIKVKQMEEFGKGEAKLALQRLKAQLAEEGLFSRKRSIPTHPKRIGIITSSVGRAKGDIETVAKEQNPYVVLELYGVGVQGKSAPESIKAGIEFMDKRGYDVLIVGRGGGSEEELYCFNSEIVVRAMYNTQTPIVAAVGHAADNVLANLVADAYYATPSHAVGKLIPNVVKDIKTVEDKRLQLRSNILRKVERYKSVVSQKEKLLARNNPESQLKDKQNRLAMAERNLSVNINRKFEARMNKYKTCVARLDGLAPTKKLVNGFGYIASGTTAVTSVSDVKEKDTLVITIHDGEISAEVKETVKKNFEEEI